jgi:bacterioferritin (cytochrome b1)
MNTKRALVAVLKEALQAELKAVKMYAAHAEAIPDQEIAEGLQTILEVEKEHVRQLAARIEALQGEPVVLEPTLALPVVGPVTDPSVIADLVTFDLDEEQWAITHYASALADYVPLDDAATWTMLEENLVDELRHARWLRDRLREMDRLQSQQGRQ